MGCTSTKLFGGCVAVSCMIDTCPGDMKFTHTWAPRNLAYGHEVPRVVSSLSEEEQDALMKNIRRRTTPQPIISLLISN
ncbi:hypothetical protein DY000_02031321 [Brassica cretica]|uniref:Uncharacterized protein n=1 Tax=Brassica cretica TaxID=69181 RepID=A0ABQ7DGR7_BRACR|nr:hypothetical protein DY000_02031321 [Brassica cretica]